MRLIKGRVIPAKGSNGRVDGIWSAARVSFRDTPCRRMRNSWSSVAEPAKFVFRATMAIASQKILWRNHPTTGDGCEQSEKKWPNSMHLRLKGLKASDATDESKRSVGRSNREQIKARWGTEVYRRAKRTGFCRIELYE